MQPRCQILIVQSPLGRAGFTLTDEFITAGVFGYRASQGALLRELLERAEGSAEGTGARAPLCPREDCRREAPADRPEEAVTVLLAELTSAGLTPPTLFDPFSGERLIHHLGARLWDYFHGRPVSFGELPVDLRGFSLFSQRVLQECRRIPFGATTTYGELARRIGKPGAPRAVGQALARNPVPLVIPCHRVVASGGGLRGFSGPGGISAKARLLAWERRAASAYSRG